MKKLALATIMMLCIVSVVHADELSKEQIRKIANQYIDAFDDQNFDAWQSLFLDTGDVSQSNFSARAITNIDKIKIKEIDGHNVRLQMTRFSSQWDGWLQILPSGKIKYGAIIYQHPIPVAFLNQHTLAKVYSGEYYDTADYYSSEALLKTGVPTFGLKRRGKPHTQLKSLKQIKEWLIGNGENWDRSEPKLSCPEDQFKECLRNYK